MYKEHIIREPSLAEIYDEERPSCKQTLGIFFLIPTGLSRMLGETSGNRKGKCWVKNLTVRINTRILPKISKIE